MQDASTWVISRQDFVLPEIWHGVFGIPYGTRPFIGLWHPRRTKLAGDTDSFAGREAPEDRHPEAGEARQSRSNLGAGARTRAET
jgi:hypothetical protein